MREMKTKAMNYHFMPVRLAHIKYYKTITTGIVVEKRNSN